MSSSKRIVFVTGNANKLREVKEILLADSAGGKGPGSTTLEIDSRALDLPETQGTTQDIAKDKAKAAARIVGGPCITEDTSLGFKAMNGLPGPYIKWFLKELGHDGLNTMLSGFPTKDATALCTFGYCVGPDAEPIVFEGATEGKIVPPRGPKDFGWDPIFEVAGTGLTYAEMPAEQKNTLSHRYRALDKLRKFLQEQE